MLVRLKSSTSGEMIMFAEHAHALWEWMGKEGSAHGVFTTDQLPQAIVRLREGIKEDKLAAKRRAEEARTAEKNENESEGENEEDGAKKKDEPTEEPVLLAQRAQPLLNLMEWTCKEEGFITWEASGDF